MKELFSLNEKTVVITGAAGLLGRMHCEAVAQYGGIPILLDVDEEKMLEISRDLNEQYGIQPGFYKLDITNEKDVEKTSIKIFEKYGRIDVLINNAAKNPAVDKDGMTNSLRLESFPLEKWEDEIRVGLTGSFFCTKYFGKIMADNCKGSIINVSSDLGIIAPNQKLYSKEGVDDNMQDVKPVTYSVIKTGLIGLTRYVATYWADKNVRCNALCPGGVYNGQAEDFVKKVSDLIPFGRMANKDEYKGAIVFLASDASSYMNGSILSVDGGRTAW